MKRLLGDAQRALDLDADYGPAHLEQGRILLVLGEAEKAKAATQT